MNGILSHSTNSVKILINNQNVDINIKNAIFILLYIHRVCPFNEINFIRGFQNIYNFFYQTLLHLACENNEIEIVKLLKDRKDFDISACDNNGETGLDIAKANNLIDIINILSNL